MLKILMFTISLFLVGCEKFSFLSKPESCIANFKEEGIDFDKEKKFLYFKSRNPKVSNLFLVDNQPEYEPEHLGQNSDFLGYRYGKSSKYILVDLISGILYPHSISYFKSVSNEIYLLGNELKNEIYIFRLPNKKIFTINYSSDFRLVYQSRDLLELKNGSLYGVINLDGKVIVPFQYDKIELGSRHSPIIAIQGQTKDLYHANGTLLLSITQDLANGDSINNKSENGFILYQKNSLWGVLDQNAKHVIPPTYELITEFVDGLAAARKDDLWGYINEKGNVVVPIISSFASKISNGIGRKQEVSTNDCIFIDNSGKEFYRVPGNAPSSYEACSISNTRTYLDTRSSKDSKLIAKLRDNRWEEIDTAQSNSFTGGDYIISKNGKFGIISHDERFFIPPDYDKISYNEKKKQYLLVLNGKSAIYDADGKPLSNFLNGLVYECTRERCLVQDSKTGKFGYTESNGKVIIETILDYGEGFSEGIAKISNKGKWQFIDEDGKAVMNFSDGDFGSFSGGVFWRKEGSMYGYQDIKGQWIVDPLFSYAETLNNGIAIIGKEGKFGLIGKKGKFLIPAKWDRIERDNFPVDSFMFTLGSRKGIAHFSKCNE